MDICVKAGKGVLEKIREGAFHVDGISTCIGPGAGPRWLVAAGFDLTLLREKILGRKRPVILLGASAGALRFAAWVQPEAEKSYRNLLDGYISLTFDDRDDRRTVARKIEDVIDRVVENDAIPFALANKRYRLAVVTARARKLAAVEWGALQAAGLAYAFLSNALYRGFLRSSFERVLFYTGPLPPRFVFRKGFRGQTVPLGEANFKPALLASSAIPLVVSGVKDIFGAPPGTYRDGGLVDYHLNGKYGEKEGDVTLFFSHQERIVPTWLDKKLSRRKPPEGVLDNVLMVHPAAEFVEKLPGGKVPDRDDFKRFWKEPGTRIAGWRQAVERSSHFGEVFLELLENGKLKDVVTPLSRDGR
jgi:hypothetical protein